jgi:hypothetical protein
MRLLIALAALSLASCNAPDRFADLGNTDTAENATSTTSTITEDDQLNAEQTNALDDFSGYYTVCMSDRAKTDENAAFCEDSAQYVTNTTFTKNDVVR